MGGERERRQPGLRAPGACPIAHLDLPVRRDRGHFLRHGPAFTVPGVRTRTSGAAPSGERIPARRRGSGERYEPGRRRRRGDRTTQGLGGGLARLPPALSGHGILALQRLAGNAAVAQALRPHQDQRPTADVARSPARPGAGGDQLIAQPPPPAVQRFPIPTKQQIQASAGYTGGKHRKGTWAALGQALDEHASHRDRDHVALVDQCARKADATFDDTKKQKKVGAETVAAVREQLARLLVDCAIQMHLFDVEDAENAVDLPPREGTSRVDKKIAAIRSLLPRTEDVGGTLQSRLHLLEQSNRRQVSDELITALKGWGYRKGRPENFWYPQGAEFDYPLPHVAWKAHLAAKGPRQALDVVGNAIPVLKQFKVQHKVDTNPEMFGGTEKLVTIYPPRAQQAWAALIARLESVVGGQLKLPPGELAVGGAGRVGMRHGQITALTSQVLQQEANTSCTPSRRKVDGYSLVVLTPLGTTPAPPVYATQPASALIIRDGVLYFYYPTRVKKQIETAIFLNGEIRPDPREAPNPYNQPLPEGVEEPGVRW